MSLLNSRNSLSRGVVLRVAPRRGTSWRAAVRRSASLWIALLTAAFAVACDVEGTAVEPGYAVADRSEGNASVYWNGVARELVSSTLASTPFAIRGYAILSVAQYQAAIAAEQGKHKQLHPSVHVAISAASVTALSYLFPAKADSLEAMLDSYLTGPAWPGAGRQGDPAAGEVIGRMVGEAIVARAQTDNFFAPWTGTVPEGPGIWYSSTNPPTAPGGAAFGQAKTFLLASGNQFRPAPPPAFGSSEFADALAEVRLYSDTRTPAQDSLAKFWHLPAGTYAPPGYWNDEASTLAAKYQLGEREAAHVLALMNMVIFDALIASHEAKYHYWLMRPSQADAGIQLSVGLPNFPSYPSNHAAISAGAAKILGRAFPAETQRLRALGEEAAFSRVVGGIHYKFDGEAGIELGRTIADWAIAHDARKHEPFLLRD